MKRRLLCLCVLCLFLFLPTAVASAEVQKPADRVDGEGGYFEDLYLVSAGTPVPNNDGKSVNLDSVGLVPPLKQVYSAKGAGAYSGYGADYFRFGYRATDTSQPEDEYRAIIALRAQQPDVGPWGNSTVLLRICDAGLTLTVSGSYTLTGEFAVLQDVSPNDKSQHYFEFFIDESAKRIEVVYDGDTAKKLRIVCPNLEAWGGISLLSYNSGAAFNDIAIFDTKATSKPESNRPPESAVDDGEMKNDVGGGIAWETDETLDESDYEQNEYFDFSEGCRDTKQSAALLSLSALLALALKKLF